MRILETFISGLNQLKLKISIQSGFDNNFTRRNKRVIYKQLTAFEILLRIKTVKTGACEKYDKAEIKIKEKIGKRNVEISKYVA